MQLIEKDGVTLAYEDINAGLPPMLLVHGWGCDHASLDAQAEFFANSHRVVSVDLRGHGKSDGPVQDYTMAAFADDRAWLCEKLRLIKPIVIGHSMGGSIVLELAARYPDVPASIVLLNSFVFMPQAILDMQKMVLDGIRGSDYVAAYRESISRLFLPTDEGPKKEHFLASHPRAPQHVLTSAFVNHVTEYDGTSAAARCRVPVAYIGDVTTATNYGPSAVLKNAIDWVYPDAPREWAKRLYNIQRWTPMERGGHFAPTEEPVVLARDIAAFFASLI